MIMFSIHLVAILACFNSAFAGNPSDPFFNKQWSLHNDGTQTVEIDADDFHTILQKGSQGIDIGWLEYRDTAQSIATNPVIVAVIDSGLDAGHPDLVGRVAPGAYDFLLNFPIVTDRIGHGTHVSGIIAANADNGTGIAGITPSNVKLLPLTVLWPDNDPKSQRFAYIDPTSSKNNLKFKLISDFTADAIRYSIAHGASIINISFIWPKIVDTANVRAAVQDAAKAGVLLVVAAGNDRKDQATYPCSYENVLCVGSISNTGSLSLYSNYGGLVDILAPGDGIISTYPQKLESTGLRIQGYEKLSGTSQAAPHVSAIAAILKSAYPNISLNELKARLLISSSETPSDGSSLYGLVNLPRSLNAKAQPVYLPNFKSLSEILIDEDSLQSSGQISIQNLWQTANKVNIQLSVNGVTAGSVNADSLGQGESIALPWSYKFPSLDSPTNLQMKLTITDANQSLKNFYYNATAMRNMQSMSAKKSYEVPGVKASDWISVQNGHPFSTVNIVDNYPRVNGLPRYYKQTSYNDTGSQLLIYDPASTELVHQVQVPGIKNIRQVIHTSTGYVITGVDQPVGSNQNPSYWEFYFLDLNFIPLYGSAAASEWQISSGSGQSLVRDYSLPGSWLASGGKLVPSFFSKGSLPPKDNFGELDIRHYQSSFHLYFMSPVSSASVDNTKPLQLEMRALDNAAFRQQNPDANLLNVIPTDPSASARGELHVLLNQGNTLSAVTQVWNIKDTANASLQASPGWDSLAASGTPAIAKTGDPNLVSSVFVNFFDNANGSLAWTDKQGKFIDRTNFSFHSAENPVTGLIGAFDIPVSGRSWFLESSFNLIAYHQESKASAISTNLIPIERDSSFASEDFSQMFTPVTVGDSSNSTPGVYIDSTLVRGNQVGVVVWNRKDGLIKPLRYSMRIPDACLEMPPVQEVDGNFGLPMLCATSSGGIEFELFTP